MIECQCCQSGDTPPSKTDLERFVELYKSFGVECMVMEGVLRDDKTGDDTPVKRITLSGGKDFYAGAECTQSNKFDGFLGFYSEVLFTPDGKFIGQGFWE